MSTEKTQLVDPREYFLRSHRFDLSFKIELARCWLEGDAVRIREAEEAYLEMVRARCGFYEREPHRRTPDDFLNCFRRVVASIQANGFDPNAAPIPIDADGELINGAHRLSVCIALGVPCRVALDPTRRAGGSVESAFRKGNIHPAVADWGIRAYLRLAPQGCLASHFGTLADHPAAPFPDWRVRAEEMRSFHLFQRIRRLRYLLIARWRTGRSLEKARGHAEEIACRLRAYEALADYWDAHPRGSDELRIP